VKKYILPIVGVLVLAGGIIAGVFLVRRNQELRTQASPATNLTLSTLTTSPQEGDAVTADVNITTNENVVVAVKLEIEFDPQRLEATGVTPGTFITNAQEIGPDINNNTGIINYELRTPLDQDPAQGTGKLAIITFNTIDSGAATVNFGNGTVVGSSSEAQNNTLNSVNSIVYDIAPAPENQNSGFSSDELPETNILDNSIGGAGLSPSPTATATSTPLASASPTPTSTNLSSPTPSLLPDTAEVTPTIMLGGFGAILLVAGALLFAI
jgi:hypothetical protein